jgi:hypothetical protein
MTQDFLRLEDLEKSTFDPYVEQKFLIHFGVSERIEVELVNISEVKSQKTESFSLLFRGPFDKILAQGTYRMEHPKMGTFELFLVPVMVAGDRSIHYEAVFNRLI